MRNDAQHEHVILGELDELAVAAVVDDLLGERGLHDGCAVREQRPCRRCAGNP